MTSSADRFTTRSGVLLFACLLCAILDGYDVAIIAYVIPEIAGEWSVPLSTFGWIFSVGLIGLVLGSLGLAPAADRYGRRVVMMSAVFAAAAATTANALVGNIAGLLVSRFFVGLTVGVMTALVIAIAFEAAPRRLRASVATLVGCGFSLGNLLSGILASAIIPHWGWRVLFFGAVGCFLLVGVLLYYSLVDSTPRPTEKERVSYIASVKALLAPGQIGLTTTVWLLHFGGVGALYILMSWMPALLTRSGYSTSQAAFAASFISMGGILGGVISGILLSWAGKKWLVVNYTIGAAVMIALPLFFNSPLIFAVNMLAGFCVVGGYICNNVVAADVYPARLRASGVGWAQGVGRTGSVLSPLLVTFALQLNASNTAILMIAAVFLLMSGCASFMLVLRKV